jgi:signal transduction histidine kinase
MTAQIVLNVDDTGAKRYLKSRVLRGAGFEVLEAPDGTSALRLAFERRPDLVLLDLKLPDISGFDVCRILKSDPKSKDIPVVHISATFVGEETKVDSAQAGADVYLAEPVGPQELTSTVRTVLRLRATERTLAEREARLRVATEGAGVATWDLSPESGPATWGAHFYAMLGLDRGATPASLKAWLDRVRPDEREAAAASLSAALRAKGSFAMEHWIVRADNREERCIAVFGTMQPDDTGQPKRLIGVAMDITERKRAEAEREAALEQARAAQRIAEDAARMKDEFLAALSHELRTPMTAVLGWLHLARSGSLPPNEQARALATVERNARLQVKLVEDLLDVSGMITGKLELEEEVVALDEVLRDAVESARPRAEERGVSLRLGIGEGSWAIRGSARRVEQVFTNLLSNAIKFSPKGGSIDIQAERRNGSAAITVRDEGEGIAPELLPRVFDTFRQADGITRRRHGGLGLGLAIVKSIVELHGGQVTAESEGPGRGAKFMVGFPLLQGEQRATAGWDSAPVISADALRGLRILAVDDQTDHRELVEQIIASSGALVRCASGAGQALELVGEWRPDLLILDIAMPSVDGYELLGRLRESLHATAESLPAIALTGFAAPSDAARAENAGFQAHMAKPFQTDALIGVISRLAMKSGRRRAR